MSYHHCPIEPDDWSNGPNDENMNALCPKCGHKIGNEDDDAGAESFHCEDCGWTGQEPTWEPDDYEPPDIDF